MVGEGEAIGTDVLNEHGIVDGEAVEAGLGQEDIAGKAVRPADGVRAGGGEGLPVGSEDLMGPVEEGYFGQLIGADVEKRPTASANLLDLPNLREQGHGIADEGVAGFDEIAAAGTERGPQGFDIGGGGGKLLAGLEADSEAAAEVKQRKRASGAGGDLIGEVVEQREGLFEGREMIHLGADVDVQAVDG